MHSDVTSEIDSLIRTSGKSGNTEGNSNKYSEDDAINGIIEKYREGVGSKSQDEQKEAFIQIISDVVRVAYLQGDHIVLLRQPCKDGKHGDLESMTDNSMSQEELLGMFLEASTVLNQGQIMQKRMFSRLIGSSLSNISELLNGEPDSPDSSDPE